MRCSTTILIAPLLAALQCGVAAQTTSGQQATAAPELDWAVVYVMSYDNNLERCGPIILNDLERGVTNAKARVLVLHDDKDKGGLKRWVITESGRKHDLLETDDMASESVLADYFAWVAKEHPAKRYAVIFLNHGGDLDNMCLDDWTGRRDRKKWLSAQKMGPVMREFRKQAPGEVELLFLQQCGRGTIDNLYNFRASATAVMASQFVVGAPNTYYTKTVQALCSKPKTSAVGLAKKIMQTDKHYAHYVCVDGARLADLPAKLDPVIDRILADESPGLGRLRPCFGGWGREGETNYDLVGWLERAADAAGLKGSARKPINAFTTWIEKELILASRQGPQMRGNRDNCGLALYVPVAKGVRSLYRDYPLRKDSRLGELWDAMYPVQDD